MTALAYHRAGIHIVADAAVLEVVGRFGTAGLTMELICGVLRRGDNSLALSCRRLIKAGLLEKPSRDTGQGRPNRYVITPQALQLLRRLEPVTLPAQQIPLTLTQ